MVFPIRIHHIFFSLHFFSELAFLLFIPIVGLPSIHVHLLSGRHIRVLQLEIVGGRIVVPGFGISLMIEGHGFCLGKGFVCGCS